MVRQVSVALWAAVLVSIGIGAARMWPVYTLYSPTFDEPLHITAGREWLERGTYTYNLVHPPLPRVAVALGPYWVGENLRASRLGTLPFFALACVLVGHWARRWYGDAAAVASVALFSTLPPILGHASLATTDMGAAATFLAALYAWTLWLEEQSAKRTVWLGVATAAAMLSKTSALPYLAACGGVGAMWLRVRPGRVLVRRGAVAGGVAAVLIWAGYRFQGAPFSQYQGQHDTVARWLAGHPGAQRAVVRAIEAPLPLMQVVRGLGEVVKLNRKGQVSYFLGEQRRYGWWYFFPVLLAVKTPLGFLALAVAGAAALLAAGEQQSRPFALPALYAVTVLAVCLPARLNMGVRHILQIYPLLSLAAGYAVAKWLAAPGPWWRRAAVGVLVGAAVVESARAHPDYLPYFNALAGDRPERFQGDSDLDWGQDLGRLSRRLRELGVKEVAIAYFGSADLERAGLPRFRRLAPGERASGWVAVSVRYLVMPPRGGTYDWLKPYRPVEVVGKTMRLYRLEDEP